MRASAFCMTLQTSFPASAPMEAKMKADHNRTFRITTFALLYFVQGAGLAYFRNFQKPYLSSLQIDPDIIGLISSLLLLPFILKIFIGILSDRVNLIGLGHRKPYIILGLLLAAISFAGAGFVLPDQNLTLFSILILLGSFSVTLFDSTTDGLAIDTTPSDDYGKVQGIMVGGRAAGIILLSLLFGLLVQRFNYRVVFIIIGAMMLLPLILVLRIKEPPQREEAHRFDWSAFGVFTKPQMLLFAAYAVIYSIASFGIDGLITFFLSDHFGAAETVIGQYGSLRGIGAVFGSILGGLIIDRLGRRTSSNAAVLLISVGGILIGIASSSGMLLIMGLLWGLFWAFQETIFFALAMDLTDARIAATMFAIMMAISNLGTAVGEGLATALVDNVGFAGVFIGLSVINLACLPILGRLFRRLGRDHTPVAGTP